LRVQLWSKTLAHRSEDRTEGQLGVQLSVDLHDQPVGEMSA
jgi:hypothetical protein